MRLLAIGDRAFFYFDVEQGPTNILVEMRQEDEDVFPVLMVSRGNIADFVEDESDVWTDEWSNLCDGAECASEKHHEIYFKAEKGRYFVQVQNSG